MIFFFPFVCPFTGVHLFLFNNFFWCLLSCSGFMHPAWPEHQPRPCPLLYFQLLHFLSSSFTSSTSLLFVRSVFVSSAVSLPPLWMNWTSMASLHPLCLSLPQHRSCFLNRSPSSTFAFLSTLVFPAFTCNMSVKLPSIYSSLDVMNDKERYMERCIYGWAEGPMS